MKKKIVFITLAILLTIYLFSPIYIFPEKGWASEFFKEKGWNDWHAWSINWEKEFLICDSGSEIINSFIFGVFKKLQEYKD